MTEPDYVEVGLVSHELGVRHGAFALSYAQKMVERANMADDEKAVAFWRAVVVSLRPRNPN